MLAVPQASMRSTQRRAHGLTLSPFAPRYLFQPSSTVKRSFAGRGIYMPQSIKSGSGHASHRNREAVTLALQGRYCSLLSVCLSAYRGGRDNHGGVVLLQRMIAVVDDRLIAIGLFHRAFKVIGDKLLRHAPPGRSGSGCWH